MEAEKELEIEIIEKPVDNGNVDVDDNHSDSGEIVDDHNVEQFKAESEQNGALDSVNDVDENILQIRVTDEDKDDEDEFRVNDEEKSDVDESVPQIEIENENGVVINVENGDKENDQEIEISEEMDNGNVEEEDVSKPAKEENEKELNGGDGEKVVVVVEKEADVDEIDADVKRDLQDTKEEEKNKEPNNNTATSVKSSIAKFGTPKKDVGMFRMVQTEKCAACQKTVYAMERLEMNGNIYHKNCFKCSHCSARLTAKTFSMNEGVIYCLTHFKQLFARKGNYDEGFGRQQYKKKWGDDKSKDSTATA